MKITRLLLALVLAAAGLGSACTSEAGPAGPTGPPLLDGSSIIGSGGKTDSTSTSTSDTTTSDTTGTGG